MRTIHLLAVLLLCTPLCANADETPPADTKLTGTVIGTATSVNYNTNTASTTVNTRECAFDGDFNTYFASYDRSFTWVGLDLGEPHVITSIGWACAKRNNGSERMMLGVFEGANSPDFMDALPLHIITETSTSNALTVVATTCSKGFRYVRYVSPSDMRCNVGELEFHGHPGEGDDTSLYRLTNLPTVSIHTANAVEPYDKVHNIDAIITIISDKAKPLRADTGVVRLRGNGSLDFPKKPYRIKYASKHRVLDAPAKAKKWTLINNYADKTLMRNLLAFELSRGMGLPYTPYGHVVDVLLNGEYKGCYQLCDHIDVKKNRVDLIDTLAHERPDSLALTEFLIEVDARASTEPVWFKSAKGTPITIHHPDDDEITELQRTVIQDAFNAMEQDWTQSLDLNTFLRHFLVGELAGNTDTYWSTYMYKHRENDTIYVGPVWDFDLAFENDTRTMPINAKTDYVYRSGGSNTGNMRSFADNIIIRSDSAKARLLDIWGEARQGSINERHLMAYIDSMEEALQQSQKLNFMRWPIMYETIHLSPPAWGGYEAEVQNVRRYLSERLLWLDNKLGYTYIDAIAETPQDKSLPTQVFNLAGQPCTTNMRQLPPGIYIVRQGQRSTKVRIK